MDVLKRFGPIIFFTFTLLWLSKALFLHNYPDFNVFYGGLKAYFAGSNPYLITEGSVMKFLYPPFALLFFFPLSFFSREVASVIWVGFSIALLIASNALIFLSLKKKLNSPEFFILNGLSFMMFCVKFNLGMGQFNTVNLFLVSLALYALFRKKEVAAGALVGLSLLLKVLPLFFLPYFLINRQWKAFISSIVTGIIGTFLGIVFINKDLTTFFFTSSISGTLRSWPLDYYNQALSGFLGRALGTGELSSLLKISLTLLLIFITFYVLWKSKNKLKTLPLGYTSLLPLTLITLTFSWQHYFVLVIPAFIVLYFDYRARKAKKMFYGLLLFSYVLVGSNLSNPGSYPVIIQSHMLWGTLLLLGLSLHSISTHE